MRRLVIEMQINIGHDTTQARPPTKALKVSLAVERNEELNFNQILCCDIETFPLMYRFRSFHFSARQLISADGSKTANDTKPSLHKIH